MSAFDPMATTYDKTSFDTNLFGKLEVTAKRMYKPQGEKMREWQDGDPETAKNVRFDFSLTTIDAMGLTRPVQERNTVSFSDDWNNAIWPSIEALGCKTLRDINGKFVEVEMVPNGRKYTNKEGKEREETYMKFLRIFDSESACVKAYESDAGVSPSASDALRAEWADTIDTLVTISKGDMTVLAKKLKAAGSPFDVESELVKEIMLSQAVLA